MTKNATSQVGKGGNVTRDDIEAKLRDIRGEVDTVGEPVRTSVESYGVMVASALAVAVVALSYLFGRRKAKRTTTVVEVRRV